MPGLNSERRVEFCEKKEGKFLPEKSTSGKKWPLMEGDGVENSAKAGRVLTELCGGKMMAAGMPTLWEAHEKGAPARENRKGEVELYHSLQKSKGTGTENSKCVLKKDGC